MDRPEQVRRRLTEELSHLAAAHEVPGATVAVLVDGQVVEATTGAVNLGTGVEVTPDSLFMIQSITKVWTATLVMQLLDDGLIELDAPIQNYLPSFRTGDERASASITVRHLLTHTGGFEGDIWASTTAGDDALQRFVEDLVSCAAQYAPPGEMYSYCNAGYGVLGRLVEVMRQSSYANALRRFLAAPLGIKEIAFCANEALAFRTAIGHVRAIEEAEQRPLPVWALMPASNPAAGNQLAMSARALITFARMHVADGLGPNGARLLSSTSARAMRQWQVGHPAAIDAHEGHGLGWVLDGRPGAVEHGGDAIGVEALLRMVPDKGVAIAMLTNGGAAGPVVDDLLDPLLTELTGLPSAPKLPSVLAHVPVPMPERYVGRYENRRTVAVVTLDDGGHLWLTVDERNEARAMAEAAGLTAQPDQFGMRRIGDNTFLLIGSSGSGEQVCRFLGDAPAVFLHLGGRAVRRVD